MRGVESGRAAISKDGSAPHAAEPGAPPAWRLVRDLQTRSDSEAEVVETAARLVNRGHVVRTGNFRGQRLHVSLPALPN